MSRGRVREPGFGSRNASRASKALRATTLLGAVGALVLTACGATVTGHATSPLTDPFRAGGLPVVDGPSDPRGDAPSPTGTVQGTDGGEIDRVALLSVNDIQDFWSKSYGPPLKGSFAPVEEIHSYDADDPLGPTICGETTYKLVNAFYCNRDRLIAWDRGTLLPLGEKFFGDMAITGVLAHEYGHAIQYMADLVDRRTPTIVAEQQADCFAGSYMRWVAEGNSPRFTLSTADGLNLVLAGLLTLRDPIITPEKTEMLEEGHGSAFERISAFQMGFVTGTTACAGINLDEIEQRRGDLPEALDVDEKAGAVQTGDLPVTGGR
jgi:predicted metalloprotease